MAQGRVQRGGLAGTGGPGDQDNTRAQLNHALPATVIIPPQAQFLETLQQHIGIENPHHQLFTEGGGQGGEPELHFIAIRGSGFQPAVLGPAFFGDIKTRQNFEATGHRRCHRRRQVIDLVQYTIDAKTNIAHIPTGFNVNVAGPLLKGVLQQPVDDTDNMLVVGVRLGLAAQLHHGLEVGEFTALPPGHRPGTLYRTGHGIEFFGVPLDIPGVRQHPAHRQSGNVLQVLLPQGDPGFGTGHGHRLIIDGHRQNLVTLGETLRHDFSNGSGIDLQRINVHHRLPGLLGQKLQQRRHIQHFARGTEVSQFLFRQKHQGVHANLVQRLQPDQVFGGEPPRPCQSLGEADHVEPSLRR